MNRKLLVELLQDGMHYSTGKHRFWISRCFEITVRPNKVVELDEYESFAAESGSKLKRGRGAKTASEAEMFHVGRSILHPKDKQVIEEPGEGWDQFPKKKT